MSNLKKATRMVAILGLATSMALFSTPALAVDNPTFTKLFQEYDASLDAFVKTLVAADWAKAKPQADDLEAKSNNLRQLAEKDANKNWLFDVTNLYHHSQELQEAVKEKNGVESVYLVSTLISHIGYIQAANPLWLKEYIGQQIKVAEAGIPAKKQEETRDAAEIIHTSANKIVLSAGTMKEVYAHTRWLDDVREMNGLGDSIIEDVNKGDWNAPVEKLVKIKLAYDKWVKAFK